MRLLSSNFFKEPINFRTQLFNQHFFPFGCIFTKILADKVFLSMSAPRKVGKRCLEECLFFKLIFLTNQDKFWSLQVELFYKINFFVFCRPLKMEKFEIIKYYFLQVALGKVAILSTGAPCGKQLLPTGCLAESIYFPWSTLR